MRDDEILLASLEKISAVVTREIKELQNLKSIHVQQIMAWSEEIRAYSRIFEEISLPARLIVEHILESWHKDGQMAIETPNIKQEWAVIKDLKIHKFGVILLTVDTLKVSWRDGEYNYFFYPDKVEMRMNDEKSFIKLFFSRRFTRRIPQDFADLVDLPQVTYVHPSLVGPSL